MTPTTPLKEALAWADRNKNNPLACDHKPMIDTLAAAVRQRDEEIARLRGFHESCENLRSLLKTAEEEIAGLKEVLDGLGEKIDMIRDFDCCDVSSKFCGWKESIAEVVSAFDAATKTGEKL